MRRRKKVDTETIMKVGLSAVGMFHRYRTVKAERLDSAMPGSTLVYRHRRICR
jgi:hypothetical protein